jgi:hypothetical protein
MKRYCLVDMKHAVREVIKGLDRPNRYRRLNRNRSLFSIIRRRCDDYNEQKIINQFKIN